MTDAAVRTTALVRRFGDTPAVDGVDLEVAPGEVFGFLGPNGAGKTTTVRMLCTLLTPSEGRAFVAGLDVVERAADVRRVIGVALQEIGLDPIQTGRELLELQAALYRVPHPRDRAAELLDLVGLTEAADRRVRTYSGGMKRRLDLASALVHAPSVLFLDEPTTGLDPGSRLTVWEEVRRINAGGTTVFLTTQYLEEADALCERVAIIDHGRVVADGTPDGLKSAFSADVVTVSVQHDHEGARTVVAGLPGVVRVTDEADGIAVYVDNGAQAVPGLLRALDLAGITVGGVSIRRPSLDDVFLEATGRRLEGASEGNPA